MAAICNWCKKKMNVGTCIGNTRIKFRDGKEFPAVPHNLIDEENCHDCGVEAGGHHHPGCDMERCPRCKGQLISCDCEVQ